MMDSPVGGVQLWNFLVDVLTGRVIITYSWLEMTDETALLDELTAPYGMSMAFEGWKLSFRILERGYLC